MGNIAFDYMASVGRNRKLAHFGKSFFQLMAPSTGEEYLPLSRGQDHRDAAAVTGAGAGYPETLAAKPIPSFQRQAKKMLPPPSGIGFLQYAWSRKHLSSYPWVAAKAEN